MACVPSNSKTLTTSIKYQAGWIHLVGSAGGNEPNSKQLDRFEQYLPGDDFAPRPNSGEKSGA